MAVDLSKDEISLIITGISSAILAGDYDEDDYICAEGLQYRLLSILEEKK